MLYQRNAAALDDEEEPTPKKKSRTRKLQERSANEQAKWDAKFQLLLAKKNKHGDTVAVVPAKYDEDPKLGSL